MAFRINGIHALGHEPGAKFGNPSYKDLVRWINCPFLV